MAKDLPREYGDNLISVMVQGPQVLFVYWEMAEVSWNSICSSSELYLRFYQLSELDFGKHLLLKEVRIDLLANNWYFCEAQAESFYVCELGLKEEDEFIPILRSNPVLTPAWPVEFFVPLPMGAESKEISASFSQADLLKLKPLVALSVPKVLKEMPFYTGIRF